MCNSYTMVLRDYRSIIPMLPWYNILYHSYSSDWLEEIVVEKFFDYNNKSDNTFKLLHRTLDYLFHQLYSNGVGRQIKYYRERTNKSFGVVV